VRETADRKLSSEEIAFVISASRHYEGGMGIAFTEIAPNDQLILEKWVEKLRNHWGGKIAARCGIPRRLCEGNFLAEYVRT
jgi:hypothetical protein